MCGRYTVNTEEEIIEMREILKEISRRLMREDLKQKEAAFNETLRTLSGEFLGGRLCPGNTDTAAKAVNVQLSLDDAFSEETLELYETGEGEEGKIKNEAFPSCTAKIIMPVVPDKCESDVKFAKWGFQKWDGNGVIFNARSENIMKSKFFSPHIKKGRCLVPASSYFEWRKVGGKAAEKYRIFAPNSRFIFMAGLFRINEDGNTEYTVITRVPADNISFIHSRMPVVLKIEYALEWLLGGFSDNITDLFEKTADVCYIKSI